MCNIEAKETTCGQDGRIDKKEGAQGTASRAWGPRLLKYPLELAQTGTLEITRASVTVSVRKNLRKTPPEVRVGIVMAICNRYTR
jgi:hypothetical protein